MFRLYRPKNGLETAFPICKSDLKVSPLFLHKEPRLAAMLCLNRVALLAYNLLQRHVQQPGLQITTRQIIRQLEHLVVIETTCTHGSAFRRLVDVDPQLLFLLAFVASALNHMVHTVSALSNSDSPRILTNSRHTLLLLC